MNYKLFLQSLLFMVVILTASIYSLYTDKDSNMVYHMKNV